MNIKGIMGMGFMSFTFIIMLAFFQACINQGKSVVVLEQGTDDFQTPMNDWKLENGILSLPVQNKKNERNNIWLADTYADFSIELEFKLDKGTNSGVFLRTSDINDPVQTGIEVQVRDDYGKSPIDMHFCGSIYEISQATQNVVKKPGEWNSLKISCNGNDLKVVLNEIKVVDINLDNWRIVGQNPDGSKNKFTTAYKNMPKSGFIGFQDHGGKVWYKNITITPL